MLDIAHELEIKEFYQHAIHVIYAVLIGQSFFMAKDVFIPISKLNSFDGAVNASALFFAYFFIITGWIGWNKSISENPHTEGRLGVFRFSIDLFILFITYYLLSLANPLNNETYGITFIWLLPLIFGFYLLWDIIKYFEYRKIKKSKNKIRKTRLFITVIFLGFFLILSYLYSYAVTTQNFEWNGNSLLTLISIFGSFGLTVLYRRRKWWGKEQKAKLKEKKINLNNKK